jgi:uncharacterized protein YqfA (UPF0365 family)
MRMGEVKFEKRPQAQWKNDGYAVLKAVRPDTTPDVWKLPVIPGETFDGISSRVKQKTGRDMVRMTRF